MKRLSRIALVFFAFAVILPILASAQIKINEFKAKSPEFIELYNPTASPVVLTNWTVSTTVGALSKTLSGSIPAFGFRVFSADSVGTNNLVVNFMSNDGDVIALRNAFATLVDDVGYGIQGGAPFAFNSTGRSPDGDDTGDWARDWEYLDDLVNANGMTPGAANVQGVPLLGSSLIINELDQVPTTGDLAPDKVEIYNPTGGAINIQNYYISDGDGFSKITNSIVVPAGGRVVLTEGVAGEGMDQIGVDAIDYGNSDMVYLYDTLARRIDQLGFNGRPSHTTGQSLQRCPDGAGPHDGYNWTTQGGGTTFRIASSNFGGTNNANCLSPPPAFVDLSRAPCVPQTSQAATVKVVALRTSTAQVRYQVNAGAVTTVGMILQSTSGDTTRWAGTIPGQAGEPLVEYTVRIMNADPDTADSFRRGYFVGTTDIGTLRVNDSLGRNVYDGYGARVQGNVTVPPGVLRTALVDFYIQDATSGINMFSGPHADLNALALGYGDLITVAGELEQFNGNLEIVRGGDCDTLTFDLDGPGSVPAPQTVQTCDLGENHEGELVRFNDAFFIFDVGGDTLLASTNHLVSNCFPGKNMFIAVNTGIQGTILPGTAGDTIRVDVVGIGSQYDSSSPYTSSYEIVPRRPADLAFTTSQVGIGDGKTTPVARLMQNAPNPWSQGTTIAFQVPEPAEGGEKTRVKLSVFDLQGRLVRTLVDTPLEPGDHVLQVSGEALGDVANGIYFYTLETGDKRLVRKMMISR